MIKTGGGGTVPWSFYDSDGRIVMRARLDDNSARATWLMGNYHDYIPGDYDADAVYIVDEKPLPRPELPIVVEGLWLRGVPAGSRITIEGTDYEGVSGDVELEFNMRGPYLVRVVCWPFMTKEYVVETQA